MLVLRPAVFFILRNGFLFHLAAPRGNRESGVSERLVATLSEHATPFTEVSPQRVSLEQAYQDLTRDSVEYRATP